MVQKRDDLDSRIVLLLVRGESHVRGVANSLGESHSTVQRKLNRLVRENVLDYKEEGRNKVFFIKRNLQAKNYVYNAERHKLMELLRRYPELNVIVEEILKKCGERLIVIFGSYAKFAVKKNSDIDVYIETKDAKVKQQVESIHSSINAKIGRFDLSSQLIKEIVKNHAILRGVEEFYEKTQLLE
jgi:predicted nucleotidyltransferase